MKNKFDKISTTATAIFLAALLVLSSVHANSQNAGVGVCTGIKGSEFGGGLYALLGGLGIANLFTGHLIAGYNYYAFDGGHDNYMKVGVQATKDINNIVAGVEVSFVRDKTIYDYSDEFGHGNPTGNGLETSAILKYPIPVENLNLNLVGNAGLVFFGDFESDGHIVESAHTAFKANVGIEILFGKKE